MDHRDVVAGVLAYATAVRDCALDPARRKYLADAHRWQLGPVRQRVEALDEEGASCLEDVLNDVERVLDAAEHGDHVGAAVRALDEAMRSARPVQTMSRRDGRAFGQSA